MSNWTTFQWTPTLKSVVTADSRVKRAVAVPGERESVEVLGTPIKSLADKKLYKTIRLRNGLTALLISTPSKTAENELAACALSVGVGHFSDPSKIQGLAHFVEHMVFSGSEKYPKENEFDSFVKTNRGMSNAATEKEATTYVFEISNRHLSKAMDMFSQFFISPLMRKKAMQRERQAVESEFAMKAPEDIRRMHQLLDNLFPEGHPSRIFGMGNLMSLRDELKDDGKLYCEAHTFRQRHYSAHRMTVAVQASADLSTIEEYVVNTFGQIPSNALPPDDHSRFAYSADTVTPEFRSLYYVKPVSDASEVQIRWCVRSLRPEYQSKPRQYLAFLLGHEGKGSLLSYLKKKVWALNVYTDHPENDSGNTSIYTLFTTKIDLTKDGLEHLDEVLEAIFSYLKMLKRLGPNERIFNEMKSLADNEFRYKKTTQPSEYVKMLAKHMHLYPPEHFLTGHQLYYKYDPKGITDLLDLLRPDMANIMVLSNKHTKPIRYDTKEKWFGTEYKREEIPKNWLQRWMNVAPYSEFRIPENNVYITTNFNIIPPAIPYVETAKKLGLDLENNSFPDIWKKMADQQPETKKFKKDNLNATVNNFRLDQPNLFRKDQYMEVWYKPDFKWRLPTAMLYFYFVVPLSLLTPKESCLLDLWNDALQQGLKEEIYPARMADLSHAMYVGDEGLMLKISGYSEKLHLLVDLTTRGMRTATEAVTPRLLEALRQARARTYHNELIEPIELAEDVLMNILRQPYVSPRDKAPWVYKITLADLQVFSQRLLKKMYLQVLIQGNIPWDQAIKIADKVHHDLKWENIPEKEYPEFKVHQLPLGERIVRVRSLNHFSTNSIVTNYYQGGVYTMKDKTVLNVIMSRMREPVFDTLRTKEQLGYSVYNSNRNTLGVLGFSITLNTQVDKHSVQYVNKRVDAFLSELLKKMQYISLKTSMPSRRVPKAYFTLKGEMENNWFDIVEREYRFQKMYTKVINISETIDWMKKYFASGNEFRKLSVQIVGNNVSENAAGEPQSAQMADYRLTYLRGKNRASEFITNIDSFKKNLPFLNVPKFQLT